MRLWVSSYPIVNQSEEPNELKTVFCGFPVQFHELVPAHSVLKARERSMEGSRTFHFTTGCLTSLVLKWSLYATVNTIIPKSQWLFWCKLVKKTLPDLSFLFLRLGIDPHGFKLASLQFYLIYFQASMQEKKLGQQATLKINEECEISLDKHIWAHKSVMGLYALLNSELVKIDAIPPCLVVWFFLNFTIKDNYILEIKTQNGIPLLFTVWYFLPFYSRLQGFHVT